MISNSVGVSVSTCGKKKKSGLVLVYFPQVDNSTNLFRQTDTTRKTNRDKRQETDRSADWHRQTDRQAGRYGGRQIDR